MEVRRSVQCRLAAKLNNFGRVLVEYAGPRNDSATSASEYERRPIDSCASIHVNNANLSFNNELSVNETPHACSANVDSCELLHAQISPYNNADFNLRPDAEDVAPSINDDKCKMLYYLSVVLD